MPRVVPIASLYLWSVLAFLHLTCGAVAENAPATTGLLGTLPGGYRTLVIAESESIRFTHSAFLGGLQARGHHLALRVAGENPVPLSRYGEFLYDNLILLAPLLNESTPGISATDIFEFIESGGNVIAAGGSDMGLTLRLLAALSGVDFDASKSRVIDFFPHEPAKTLSDARVARGQPSGSVIGGAPATESRLLLGSYAESKLPVLFSGIGHDVDSENIQIVTVLTGTQTAYSADPTRAVGAAVQNAGRSVALVSAVQARNNARVVLAGSLEMFGDEFFQAPGAGNAAFCLELSKWALRERGVLRASQVTHSRADGSAAELLLHQKDRRDLPFSLFPEPEIAKNSQVYRIKDQITYSVIIEEYDAEKGGWRPYKSDDVQMDFVMLDPFERITLNCDEDTGRFHTTFMAPDTYGIFKFRIMYRRVGYTVLSFSTQVSVRPFKHNEYERFIPAAYPYYAGAFSLMGGFFVFSFLFLTTTSKEER